MSYMAQTVINAIAERKSIRLGTLTGAEFQELLKEIARLRQM